MTDRSPTREPSGTPTGGGITSAQRESLDTWARAVSRTRKASDRHAETIEQTRRRLRKLGVVLGDTDPGSSKHADRRPRRPWSRPKQGTQLAAPPEWGLRPKDYAALATRASAQKISGIVGAATAVGATGGAVGVGIGALGATSTGTAAAWLAGAPFWLLGIVGIYLVVTAGLGNRKAAHQKNEFSDAQLDAFAGLDHRRVITTTNLPAATLPLFKWMVTRVNLAEDDKVGDLLEQLYEEAQYWRVSPAAIAGSVVPTTDLGRRAAAALAHRASLPLTPTRWLSEVQAWQSTPTSAAAAEAGAGSTVQNRSGRAGAKEREWAHSVDRHDRIREEWTDIIVDPLNVLSHSTLFDVADPRTAAFVTAYGRIQDFRAIHGDDYQPELVAEYAELVRSAAIAWTDAKARAKQAGYDWLPEAERPLARKAAGLLALAADEDAPVIERALAAQRAADMLGRIASFVMPTQSRAALEDLSRLALPAAN